MDETKHVDLSGENPGPRADPILESRCTNETTFSLLGMKFHTKSDAPSRSASGVALAVLMLAAGGTLGMLGVVFLGTTVAVPGWTVMTMAFAIFFIVVVGGLIMIVKQRPDSVGRGSTAS